MPPCLSRCFGASTTVRTARVICFAGRSCSPRSVGIWNSARRKYLRAAVWHLLRLLSSQPPLLLRQVDTPVCLMTCLTARMGDRERVFDGDHVVVVEHGAAGF